MLWCHLTEEEKNKQILQPIRKEKKHCIDHILKCKFAVWDVEEKQDLNEGLENSFKIIYIYKKYGIKKKSTSPVQVFNLSAKIRWEMKNAKKQ